MATKDTSDDMIQGCHGNQEVKSNTSDEQVTEGDEPQSKPFKFTGTLTLENIRKLQADFIAERNWDQFHAPRNVLLAMVGEVGELSEIFQWKGEVKEGLPGWSAEERHHVGQELSDVLLYLVDLADRCKVDLATAVLDKLEHNSQKYPKSQVYGSSKKYDQYE